MWRQAAISDQTLIKQIHEMARRTGSLRRLHSGSSGWPQPVTLHDVAPGSRHKIPLCRILHTLRRHAESEAFPQCCDSSEHHPYAHSVNQFIGQRLVNFKAADEAVLQHADGAQRPSVMIDNERGARAP